MCIRDSHDLVGDALGQVCGRRQEGAGQRERRIVGQRGNEGGQQERRGPAAAAGSGVSRHGAVGDLGQSQLRKHRRLGLLEAPVFSQLRLPEIADGTMPAHTASSGGRWTTAFLLSAFIPALTYYPAFALAGTFLTPSAYLPQGITNQIMAVSYTHLRAHETVLD